MGELDKVADKIMDKVFLPTSFKESPLNQYMVIYKIIHMFFK